jgi:hypothetical protein
MSLVQDRSQNRKASEETMNDADRRELTEAMAAQKKVMV